MARVRVAIKDWPRLIARIGDRARQAVRQGVVDGAWRCVPLLQQRTEQAPPASAHGAPGAFNTGEYRAHWSVRPIQDGAAVFNDRGYAPVIDGGRRAGAPMPPKRAIEQWAMRRLGLSGAEARQAAYPIARAIARRGLRPRRVLSGALQQMQQLVARSIRDRLLEAVR